MQGKQSQGTGDASQERLGTAESAVSLSTRGPERSFPAIDPQRPRPRGESENW